MLDVGLATSPRHDVMLVVGDWVGPGGQLLDAVLANRGLEPHEELHRMRVNGQVALYLVRDGGPFLLTVIGWRGGRVTELLAVLNPGKLARFHARWLASGMTRGDG